MPRHTSSRYKDAHGRKGSFRRQTGKNHARNTNTVAERVELTEAQALIIFKKNEQIKIK